MLGCLGATAQVPFMPCVLAPITGDMPCLSDECSNRISDFCGAHRLPDRLSNKHCANDRKPDGLPPRLAAVRHELLRLV